MPEDPLSWALQSCPGEGRGEGWAGGEVCVACSIYRTTGV